jgi:serine/threonine protein kinase
VNGGRRGQVAKVYTTGQRIGPYELRERLGWGGMGVVFRARQASAARDVAIKIISPALAANPAVVKRFEQEIRAAAGLQHPHILPIYDAGVDEGNPYLVMAYVGGGSLAERIAAHPDGLSPRDVSRIVGQIASALDHAHAMGVIHRDIKPGNILLDRQGNVYLSDFGVARLVKEVEPETVRPPGTDAYMAPEVAAGRDAVPASDIYGLGALAFEMLTGRRPGPAGEAVALAQQGVNPLDVRLWRPDMPRGVSVIIEQALHPDPQARPLTAAALARALDHASRSAAARNRFVTAPLPGRALERPGQARASASALPTLSPDAAPAKEVGPTRAHPPHPASPPETDADQRAWRIALTAGIPLFILILLAAFLVSRFAGV